MYDVLETFNLICLVYILKFIFSPITPQSSAHKARSPDSTMEKLKILLIGNGAREHALAYRLNTSPIVDTIYVVPGNGGTARGMPKVQNISTVKPDDFSALTSFATEKGVNLLVPGPEVPLVAGITDVCQAGTAQRCFHKHHVLIKLRSWHTMFGAFQGSGAHGGFQGIFQGLYGQTRYTHGGVSQFQRL